MRIAAVQRDGLCYAARPVSSSSGYRQKTPPNAVEIARTLLQAGAQPDALADMYGTECTTMSLLVSSSHPAQARLQVPLVELLLEFGAAIEGQGTRKWGHRS